MVEDDILAPDGWIIERLETVQWAFILDRSHRVLNLVDSESTVVESVVLAGVLFPNIPSTS